MKAKPVWQEGVHQPEFPKPPARCQVDVLVIGGGITGVTTAYLLKEAGCRVALVERYKIGGGETAHTTAHVTYVTDARLGELVSTLGKSEAQALWDAGELAMDQIETLAKVNALKCDLRRIPGYLFAAREKSGIRNAKACGGTPRLRTNLASTPPTSKARRCSAGRPCGSPIS